MTTKVALMTNDNLTKAITKACLDALHEGMTRDDIVIVIDHIRELVNDSEEES